MKRFWSRARVVGAREGLSRGRALYFCSFALPYEVWKVETFRLWLSVKVRREGLRSLEDLEA